MSKHCLIWCSLIPKAFTELCESVNGNLTSVFVLCRASSLCPYLQRGLTRPQLWSRVSQLVCTEELWLSLHLPKTPLGQWNVLSLQAKSFVQDSIPWEDCHCMLSWQQFPSGTTPNSPRWWFVQIRPGPSKLAICAVVINLRYAKKHLLLLLSPFLHFRNLILSGP